ncbi:MAG: preprotein translocase subunit SecG [Chloroflexi bacterium]|nr:preprotein translocase subunit SecG [Chloroflexota bacterium]
MALSLMLVILLQNRGSGLGGAFGQQGGGVFRTRRGLERILYRATIGLSVVFVLTSLASVRAHTASMAAPPISTDTTPPFTLPTETANLTPTADGTPGAAPSPAADGTPPAASATVAAPAPTTAAPPTRTP